MFNLLTNALFIVRCAIDYPASIYGTIIALQHQHAHKIFHAKTTF